MLEIAVSKKWLFPINMQQTVSNVLIGEEQKKKQLVHEVNETFE
jgi:hypothetical protein